MVSILSSACRRRWFSVPHSRIVGRPDGDASRLCPNSSTRACRLEGKPAINLAGQVEYEHQPTNMPCEEVSHLASESKDEDGVSIVGFCLWCNMTFHPMDNFSIHSANGSAAVRPAVTLLLSAQTARDSKSPSLTFGISTTSNSIRNGAQCRPAWSMAGRNHEGEASSVGP